MLAWLLRRRRMRILTQFVTMEGTSAWHCFALMSTLWPTRMRWYSSCSGKILFCHCTLHEKCHADEWIRRWHQARDHVVFGPSPFPAVNEFGGQHASAPTGANSHNDSSRKVLTHPGPIATVDNLKVQHDNTTARAEPQRFDSSLLFPTLSR